MANFFPRPEEAGEWRLGLQSHIGATCLGNVDCWSGSQPGTKYVSKGCEEWRQVRDAETPTWGGWTVVPQKVIPNSSPVNRQSKKDWRSSLKIEISEERQKEAYQLVCTTRRGRVCVRQTLPSHQEVEEWARLAESVNYTQPKYTGVAAFCRKTTQRIPPQPLSLVPLLLLEIEERGTANARRRLRQLLHLMYMKIGRAHV